MSSPNSKEDSNIPDKGAEGDLTRSTMSEQAEFKLKLSEQVKVTEDGRAAPKSNVIENIGGGDTKTEIKEATDTASDAGSSEITFKTAECSPTAIMKDQPSFFADTSKTDQKTITIGEKSSNLAQQLAANIEDNLNSDNNKHVDEKDDDKVQDTVDTAIDIPTSKNENIDTTVTDKDSLVKTDSNFNTEEHKNTQIGDQIAENNDKIEKSTEIIEQTCEELDDSFEDDISLRWDEETDENRPSNDALKNLDQDLGIEDKIDEICDETSPIGEGKIEKKEELGDRIGETNIIDSKTEDNGDDIVPVSEGDIKEDTITEDLTEVGTDIINTESTSKTLDTDTPVTVKKAKETIVDLKPVGTPESMDVDDVTAKSETVKLTEEPVKTIEKIDESVNEMSVDDTDVVKSNDNEGGENKMAVDAGDNITDKQTDNKMDLNSEIENKTNNQLVDESEDDINLRWDEEPDENRPSDDALKNLDQDLGIEDKIDEICDETSPIGEGEIEKKEELGDRIGETNIIDSKTEDNGDDIVPVSEGDIKEDTITEDLTEVGTDIINTESTSKTLDTDTPVTVKKAKETIVDLKPVGTPESMDVDDVTTKSETVKLTEEPVKTIEKIDESVNEMSVDDTDVVKSNEDEGGENKMAVDAGDNITDKQTDNKMDLNSEIENKTNNQLVDESLIKNQFIVKEEVELNELEFDDSKKLDDEKLDASQNTLDEHNEKECARMKNDAGLKPDVMLEIPTQGLIDLDDDFNARSVESNLDEDDDYAKILAEKTVTEKERKNEDKVCSNTSKESIKNVTPNEQPSKPEKNIAKQTSDAVKTSKDEIHPSVTGLSSKSENDTHSHSTLLSTDLTEISKKTEQSLSTEKIISTDQSLSAIQTTENEPSTSTDQSLPTPQSTGDQLSSLHDQPPSPDDQLPSTSQTDPSTSKDLTNITDVEEITDSLGLLAESSRVMDDDDEDEPDDDEDDDFDQDDESSNLLTADHSEESNTPSEVEVPKDGAKETTEPENEKEGDGSIVEKTLEMDNVEGTETLHKTPEKEKDREIEPSTNTDKPNEVSSSVLVGLLSSNTTIESSKKLSPSKTSRLEISKPKAQHMLSFVELDESSSEDEITKSAVKDIVIEDSNSQTGVMESQNTTTPKKATKMTKLNTSEISIKTGNTCKSPLIIPEISNICETAKEAVNQEVKQKPDKKMLGLEIFSLDSDEEEAPPAPPTPIADKKPTKCVNNLCDSTGSQLYPADLTVSSYFGVTKRSMVCAACLEQVRQRTETLLLGIKNMTPLFDLAIAKTTSQLVEISDSESEDEEQVDSDSRETIGAKGAKLLEEHLASILNESWTKWNLEQRLRHTEQQVLRRLGSIQEKASELDDMLNACQKETDDIRKQIYVTFEPQRKYLDAIIIHDTNKKSFTCLEQEVRDDFNDAITSKRRLDSTSDVPAKRFAKDLPSLTDTSESESVDKDDYDKDVSVVRLSQEAAPADLPPAGDVPRPALLAGDEVFAIRNAFGAWIRARIVEVHHKAHTQAYTNCRVRFDNAVKNIYRVISARCIAYLEPSPVRLSIGTRIIALFKDKEKTQEKGKRELFYSGVVAEIPNPVNSYRYLVFFDDGYAQYVHHKDTRVVCECSSLVWEEVHPFIRDFVCDYLLAYPERPMVRLHAEQRLKTEWNGKWWASKVLKVDASLALVHFERDNRTEWIYRGSTRLAPLYLELQAAERHRHRLPRSKAQNRSNMPYVEYTGHDETNKSQTTPQQPTTEELRRHAQRAVAKKSTTQSHVTHAAHAPPPPPPQQPLDGVISRVVYYTPKNAVKPLKMVTHTCSPKCKRNDLLSLKELRTYNPLAKPLLSGWERQLVRYKGQRAVVYRAPCGRRLRSLPELHRYLQITRHDMPVDLFDFNIKTHCLAEFVLNKVAVMKKDLSNGKENVPVPCVNYYDGSLPEFCSYNTERTPTAGVPLNLDPEFLCGCDCTDDCEDKSKCACWQLTLEGARTIGLDAPGVGYVYRRLPEPLPSGIYECNARCKCRSTCLNRVAQHPLQLKLQVFKTLNRGWGIRALNDVPRGAFLCVYAGNLLTDATANLDGLNEGDEYLAELDYIEVVEQMKEGYEEDIPEDIKKLDKKETSKSASESEEESPSEEEEANEDDKEDGDFQPGYIGVGLTEFSKRLRIRDKKTKEGEQSKEKEQDKDKETDNCITISDDEEVREPSRFTAQAGMGDKDFVSKYRSVRTLYGKDEACYIMDAKVQGNIGRYLNHSCSPNVFVQNVFVDTHDPRFPWVAFFALSHVKAGAELTWNYNYDIGSVPGKVLYCYCGTPNCRGRLL